MKPISDKLRDFTGQNIYVGMDVHDKSWKVHIYSDEFELKSFSQQPDVDLLCNYLQKNYKNATYQVAYEAGFLLQRVSTCSIEREQDSAAGG
ncbi:MAG: hypothetical protein KF746_27200 [Chitinophagaceae bacterium]|nr:hypothetical protein [Chitinophagaceae bacterium]